MLDQHEIITEETTCPKQASTGENPEIKNLY